MSGVSGRGSVGTQQTRAHHRRQRKRNQQRNQHGDGRGDPKLKQKTSRNRRHERDGQKDHHQRKRRCHHGEADVGGRLFRGAHRRDSFLFRAAKDVFQHHHPAPHHPPHHHHNPPHCAPP